MAIVKMNKLSVIGMKSEKDAMLKRLMDLGVVEVNNGAEKLNDENWQALVVRDGDEATVSEYDKQITLVEQAQKVLSDYGKLKSPMFEVRKEITRADYEEMLTHASEYQTCVDRLLSENHKLSEHSNLINQIDAELMSLRPWESYTLPLEEKATARLSIRLGTLPPDAAVDSVSEELEGAGFPTMLQELNRDKEQTYVCLWYFPEDEEGAMEIVKANGYSPAPIGEYQGTVKDNLEKLAENQSKLQEDRELIISQIAAEADRADDLKFYYDSLVIKRDAAKVKSKLLETEETFTFDGWNPTDKNEDVKTLLEGYTCWYEFEEPTEDDEIPVKMKNNRVVAPMEFITKLYSLPNAREIDPTAMFTLFYIIFFGMMFADVGYGLILTVATLLVLKKYKMKEGGAADLMRLLSYCGVSSAVFGVLFGSYFGDLITVVAKEFFGVNLVIKPLWLNPMTEAMTLLIVSCGLGVIHLFFGMGIKAYEQFKAGKPLEAINDNIVWYFIVVGILMMIYGMIASPMLSTIGKWLMITGLAGAIILPLFINKGSGKALGLWNIYSGVTGNLSDILSYSRLLGLGLASASIAQVVNFLAILVGGKGAGIILFLVVEIFGHTLNFAINALGAFVHSARLQYVEFFGKFYEGEGRPFEPFEKNTKYVKIIEEE